MDWILVGIGGALGSILRFLTVSGALRMFGAGFPAGTLIVNVLGSLVMGIAFVLLIERGGSGRAALLIMTGALGGFTTFSAFSLDAFALFEEGRLGAMAGYVALSVLASVAALFAGILLARAVVA